MHSLYPKSYGEDVLQNIFEIYVPYAFQLTNSYNSLQTILNKCNFSPKFNFEMLSSQTNTYQIFFHLVSG